MTDYDVFIVGGGINGCGIARDAAGRGFKVGLAEMNDLGSGTSSWSTKLIHGGLRYLEHYEFSLVRHALGEREILWGIAPHIIRPLRFVLPLHSGLRPRWLLRLGLFLYDHIGGRRKLKKSVSVDLRGPLGAPLKDEFTQGFEYSDARVDDTRLVLLNARDAAARGAHILVRTKLTAARREGGIWRLTLKDQASGSSFEKSARMLLNMAGPWVDEVIRGPLGRDDARHVRLVKGSHIVLHKLFEHDRAYIFQNGDGRIIFAIPYEEDFTLVGTTDEDFEGDPAAAAIDEGEIAYLIEAASDYFSVPLEHENIVWTFSGIRPLFDDGASSAQEATRDYVLAEETGDLGEAPLLNGFGGKITTYRVLAEEAVETIEARLGKRGRAWTAKAALPGGDFPVDGVAALESELKAAIPALGERTVRRLVRAYGTEVRSFMLSDRLGHDFGHELFEAEVAWLVAKEWARTAEDILWRRSKLGLRFSEEETRGLREYLEKRVEGLTAAA